MRLLRHHPLALMPLLLFGACIQQDRDNALSSTIVGADQDDETWVAELIEHREEIDTELETSNTSPMAGTQYLKSKPGDRIFLNRQERIFELDDVAGPENVLLVSKKEDTWYWQEQGQEVVCHVGDEAVASGGPLGGSAICETGELFFTIYPSEDQVTFIVFDPDRDEMKSFDHLLYFPPDRDYAVRARLVVHPEPDEIEMLTSRDLKKTFYRYAKVEFQLDGQSHELSAFKSKLTGDGSGYLFIPFRDATTGRETYGAGRFLEIEEPADEHFVLDFNRAFNPLCNYSPAYNCAIPPRENHLQVAIRAGEMTYPH